MRVFDLAVVLLLAAACGSVESSSSDAAPEPGLPDARIEPGTPDAAVPGDAAASTDAAPRRWSTPEIVANVNSTHFDMFPNVSPNGLELYFSRLFVPDEPVNREHEMFVAKRSSLDQPFSEPAKVFELNTPGDDWRPELSSDGLEIFYCQNRDQIYVARRSTPFSSWEAPQALGVTGFSPSISGDGRALYFYVWEGSGSDLRSRAFKVTRNAVGDAWSAPVPVSFPDGLLGLYGSVDISADELSVLITDNNHSVPSILIGRRDSKDAPFESFQSILTLRGEVVYNSARWSSDETEIYVEQHTDDIARDDIYVSRLE